MAEIPPIHEAFAELAGNRAFAVLTITLERQPLLSSAPKIVVHLPSGEALEHQAEILTALSAFAVKWQLETESQPYGVLIMRSG